MHNTTRNCMMILALFVSLAASACSFPRVRVLKDHSAQYAVIQGNSIQYLILRIKDGFTNMGRADIKDTTSYYFRSDKGYLYVALLDSGISINEPKDNVIEYKSRDFHEGTLVSLIKRPGDCFLFKDYQFNLEKSLGRWVHVFYMEPISKTNGQCETWLESKPLSKEQKIHLREFSARADESFKIR